MTAQKISLRAAFAEAKKAGISAPDFKTKLLTALRENHVPASAAYWVKVRLDVSPGETLENAIKGTSLSARLQHLQNERSSLIARRVSHHWYYEQYHTLVYKDHQWLLYYPIEAYASGMRDLYQSYWEMSVYIDEQRWQILFEDVDNYTRFEAAHVDFDLRALKNIWADLGPKLNPRLGRPPTYNTPEKKLAAARWAQRNRNSSTYAFKTYIRSIFPDDDVSDKTINRIFLPIWRSHQEKQ